MTHQQEQTIRMRVEQDGEQYLGECLEYPVMTHGRSIEELAENMRKALALFMREQGGWRPDSLVVAVRVGMPPEEALR